MSALSLVKLLILVLVCFPKSATVNAQAPSPSPSPASWLKIILRGKVLCGRCYDKHGGLTGVVVTLECVGSPLNISASTGHSGKFTMQLDSDLPKRFPEACAVRVLSSPLPDACTVAGEPSMFSPRLKSLTHSTATYTVNDISFECF